MELLNNNEICFCRNEKGAYMFGRVDLCDFVLEHPTISRFHAGKCFLFGHVIVLYLLC